MLLTLHSGIVGSDPYLAPEVYDGGEYDAAAVDIWSLAIIYCCMTLRRFPWKVPRMTDNSFKLFAAEPTPGHDPGRLIAPSKSTNDLSTTVAREFLTDDDTKNAKHHHHHHHKSEESESAGASRPPSNQGPSAPAPSPPASSAGQAPAAQALATTGSAQASTGEKKEVIRGPWRILRLLPRESRHIIHRMLDLNPKTRANIEEIVQEPWISEQVICQQFENGEVLPADDHTHVLEPPTSQQAQQKA